jgi:hypothetical protein
MTSPRLSEPVLERAARLRQRMEDLADGLDRGSDRLLELIGDLRHETAARREDGDRDEG